MRKRAGKPGTKTPSREENHVETIIGLAICLIITCIFCAYVLPVVAFLSAWTLRLTICLPWTLWHAWERWNGVEDD